MSRRDVSSDSWDDRVDLHAVVARRPRTAVSPHSREVTCHTRGSTTYRSVSIRDERSGVARAWMLGVLVGSAGTVLVAFAVSTFLLWLVS